MQITDEMRRAARAVGERKVPQLGAVSIAFADMCEEALIAALATAQPVADAEVEDVCARLAQGTVSELGEPGTYCNATRISASSSRSGPVATLIRSLHARAVRAEAERDEARQVVRDTLWMAGRYADGRRTYAVSMYNDARQIAEAGGFASKEDPTRTEPAIDGDAPEWPTLAERLRRAEAEQDRLRALLAEAKEALRDLVGPIGVAFPTINNFPTMSHARATLARLDAALTGDAP